MTDHKTLDRVAIYGCGGFGREVHWLLTENAGLHSQELVGLVDDIPDHKESQRRDSRRVYTLEELYQTHPDCKIVVAIANTFAREKVAERCSAQQIGFYNAIATGVRMSDSVVLGLGNVICAGSILTVDITIGDHVHINLNCTIGHDVRIGNHVTLAPGVHVSGCVHIEDHVTIGTGATIINGTAENPIVLRRGTVVGAGACVIRSTEANGLYVGVPAKLKSNN